MSFIFYLLPCIMLKNTYFINNLQLKIMIYAKHRKTVSLFDPCEHLRPKRRKLIKQSWAGLFK